MKQACLFLLVLLAGCAGSRHIASTQNTAVADGKLFTALFQQRAAEYRALCLQAYRIARVEIDQLPNGGRPKAIITDIDETVLDNSPYAVHRGLMGLDWEQQSWYDWTSRAAADTVPGACSFLQYAASKGVHVFYITNRDEQERPGTLKNLQRFHFPDADDAHLMLKQNGSSKEARRQQVMKDYDVVLLMGDNLADFSPLFDKKTEAERRSNADALNGTFGQRFIVLPNPNYGDWESALYQYKYSLTPAQKDSVIRSVLKNY